MRARGSNTSSYTPRPNLRTTYSSYVRGSSPLKTPPAAAAAYEAPSPAARTGPRSGNRFPMLSG